MRTVSAGLILLLSALQLSSQAPPAAAARFYQLLENRDYLALENQLRAPPRSLTPQDRSLLTGVLANRTNRLFESARLLAPLVQSRPRQIDPSRMALLLRTLADTYQKLGQYARASDTYALLLDPESGARLSAEQRNEVDGNYRMAEALRSAPPQAIYGSRQIDLLTRRNAIQTLEVPVTVGSRTEHWILDTGANISIVTRSKAQDLGLSLSVGTTPVNTFSGAVAQCHLAVIPSLHLGQMEIRNIAVLVIEDKDFYIAPMRFQIQALIGYPVLAGLGRITFHSAGRFSVSPSTPAAAESSPEGRLFMEELTPLLLLGTDRGPRLFRLDTGATSSYLTVRYWEEHRADFADRAPGGTKMDGGNGTRTIPSYSSREIKLTLGATPLTLNDVAVFTRPHSGNSEFAYGHLGQNVLKPFDSYTLDFQAMRFSVAP